MTRAEVQDLLAMVAATYPNYRPENKTVTVNTWLYFLDECTFEEMCVALKTFVKTSNSAFAPSPSQLIAMVTKPAEMAQMTELEAWALVHKAVSNSGYHAQEEFDALPEDVQRVVGGPSMLKDWGQTDYNTLDSVIASNFQRSYKAIQSKKEFFNRMPKEAAERLQQAQKLALGVK